jgi:GT2 family glycosyltransferase
MLELEVDGKVVDRFFPHKKRLDVFHAHHQLPHALLSGFEREYGGTLARALASGDVKLVARVGGQKKVLWERHGEGEGVKLDSLESTAPHVQDGLHVIFSHALLTGDDPFLQLLLKHRDLASGAKCTFWIPKSVPLEPLKKHWPRGDFRHYSPSETWDQFVQRDLSSHAMVLFLARPVKMTHSSLQSLFRFYLSHSNTRVVAPVEAGELEQLKRGTEGLVPCEKLSSRGQGVFQDFWLSTLGNVLALGGEQRVETPLLQKVIYGSQPHLGVQCLDASYHRMNGTLPKREGKDEAVPLCVVLPYRHVDLPEYREQLRELIEAVKEFDALTLYFVSDDGAFQSSSLEGIPVLRVSELAKSSVNPSAVIVATDSWSVRYARLLGYTLKSSRLYRWPEWKDAIHAFPELEQCAAWSQHRPLPELELSDLLKQTDREEESANQSTNEMRGKTPQGGGLSCVVPIYNSLSSVLMCVRSLVKWCGKDDEILLVDDCSNPGTRTALERLVKLFPQLRLVHRATNGGFIEACYSGLRAAKPENDILLVNSDIVISSTTLSALRDALTRNPETALFSTFSTGSRKLQLTLEPGETLETLAKKLSRERNPSYPTVITPEGQCLLIRRRALSGLGFFDRVFGRGFSEESDLSMRYFLYGEGMCVVDNAVNFHEQSASFGDDQRNAALLQNRPIFNARWQTAYESAFERYEEDGEVRTIQDEFSYAVPTEVDQGIDEETFIQDVHRVRHSPPVPTLPPSWLTSAEIIYFLPNIAGSGGSLSVLQHVNEMLQRGVEARVVYLGRNRAPEFPLLTAPVQLDLESCINMEWGKRKLVATHWTMAHLVRAIVERQSKVDGFYYVQDYEAWFYDIHHPLYPKVAETYSYPLKKVAKTRFLVDTVEKIHGETVAKITPGLDRTVFYSAKRKPILGAPRFAAMYRPSTPRRGAEKLVAFCRQLLERAPEAEITFFGDNEDLPAPLHERVTMLGKISRKEVAELYRQSDFVVDLSIFHGFGRVGLEGMACGAVPVLTASGGVSEYAVGGENALICDGENLPDLVSQVLRVLHNPGVLEQLRAQGVVTAERYSEWKATNDWLEIFGITPPDRLGVTAKIGEFFHGIAAGAQKMHAHP